MELLSLHPSEGKNSVQLLCVTWRWPPGLFYIFIHDQPSLFSPTPAKGLFLFSSKLTCRQDENNHLFSQGGGMLILQVQELKMWWFFKFWMKVEVRIHPQNGNVHIDHNPTVQKSPLHLYVHLNADQNLWVSWFIAVVCLHLAGCEPLISCVLSSGLCSVLAAPSGTSYTHVSGLTRVSRQRWSSGRSAAGWNPTWLRPAWGRRSQ